MDDNLTQSDVERQQRSKNHECNICNAKYFTKSELHRHRLLHNAEVLLKCLKCDYTTAHSDIFKSHIEQCREQQQSNKYECKVCGTKHFSRSELIRHRKTHKDEKPFACDQCEYKSAFLQGLNSHMNHRHFQRSRKYECNFCEWRFFTKGKLVRHQRIHSGEKPFECGKCDFKTAYSESLDSHIRRRHNTLAPLKPFKCDICDKIYRNDSELQEHCRMHTGEMLQCEFESCYSNSLKSHVRNFHPNQERNGTNAVTAHNPGTGIASDTIERGDHCTRTFANSSGLINPIVSHHHKDMECDICAAKFPSIVELAEHRRMHTVRCEKPYACEQCDHRFATKSNLSLHVSDVHKKLRPHECEICGNAFSLKWNLVVHRRTHTGEKPFQCELCAAAFTTSSKLRRHRQIHIIKKPIECDQCEFKSAHPSSLKWHVLHVHRNRERNGTAVTAPNPGTATANELVRIGTPRDLRFQSVRPRINTSRDPTIETLSDSRVRRSPDRGIAPVSRVTVMPFGRVFVVSVPKTTRVNGTIELRDNVAPARTVSVEPNSNMKIEDYLEDIHETRSTHECDQQTAGRESKVVKRNNGELRRNTDQEPKLTEPIDVKLEIKLEQEFDDFT